MKDNGLTSAYFFALLYALIIGFSFMFTKTALMYANPIDTLALRFATSFIVFLIPVLFRWIHLEYSGKNLRRIMVLALLQPIMFFSFQAFGLLYASSSEGGIIQAVTPVFTMLLSSIFLKEKTTKIQKASILLSVMGVIYIFLMKGAGFGTNVLGILLLLLSNLSFAGYSILARTVSKEFTINEASFMMITMGFVVFNSVGIGTHMIKGTLREFFLPLKSFEFTISILYLGILSTLGTSLLTNYVLSKIEAAKMSVFANLGTVITIFAGVFFLKEPLYYYHIIGSLMIIAGVIGTNYKGSMEKAIYEKD